MNYNRLTLGGFLVRSPELKYLPSNTPVCDFTIGTNRTWKSASGEKKTDAAFVDCVAFGKTAESIHKHFAKGKPILIDGYIRQDKWESKEGQKRSKLVVVCERFYFVGGRDPAPAGEENQAAAAPAVDAPEYSAAVDDGVPF